MMPELIPVLNKDAIAEKVADVAREISSDYKDGDLVLIGVLKGAFVFLADLIRELTIEKLSIDFVCVSSYGDGTETSGEIRILKDIETDVTGKDVLLVEDIVDSGLTIAYLHEILKIRQPRSIKICTMIDKLERRQNDVQPDYVCHKMQSGFVVGYGLDYAESYRNLPGLYQIKM
jgi:hypoxanthine phosphoribosyltransferase